jgi:hypothetical protein
MMNKRGVTRQCFAFVVQRAREATWNAAGAPLALGAGKSCNTCIITTAARRFAPRRVERSLMSVASGDVRGSGAGWMVSYVPAVGCDFILDVRITSIAAQPALSGCMRGGGRKDWTLPGKKYWLSPEFQNNKPHDCGGYGD